MSAFTNLSPETKAKLRKAKTVSGKVKAAVYAECRNPGAAIQFNSDVRVYGLLEALMYVEGYEKQGFYNEGAAGRILEKIV